MRLSTGFPCGKVKLFFRVDERMPVTNSLRYSSYDTPNIHLCTIRDFLELCREMDAVVERAVALDHRGRPLPLKPTGRLANLFAAQALFEVRKS